MELFTDLKSKLAFRTGGKGAAEQLPGNWEQLAEGGLALAATIDRSGRIRTANEALCRLREAEAEDVVGTNLSYLIHADDRSGFQGLVREVVSGVPGAAGRGRLLAAGDQLPVVHWILSPTLGPEGLVDGVSCLGVDVSDYLEGGDLRKEAEELTALRREVGSLKKENGSLRNQVARLEEARPAAAPSVAPSGDELPEGAVPVVEEGERLPSLAELERRYILHVLEGTKGRVSGKKGAAAILGLHPNTLRSRMEKHGIGKAG